MTFAIDMEKIARQVGINKSNLYNYYKSKDELFNTLADSAAYQFGKLIDFVFVNKVTPQFGETEFEQMITDDLFKLIHENKDGLILLICRRFSDEYALAVPFYVCR